MIEAYYIGIMYIMAAGVVGTVLYIATKRILQKQCQHDYVYIRRCKKCNLIEKQVEENETL